MSFDIDPDHIAFVTGDIARHFRAAFEREIAEENIGVTSSEARVLSHLARSGSIRQVELAERLGIAPMSLSVFLDRLEARGLVTRTPDPDDRRAKQVTLREEAAPILRRVTEMGKRIRAAALAGIDETRRTEFLETAKVIRRNLEERRSLAPAKGEPKA